MASIKTQDKSYLAGIRRFCLILAVAYVFLVAAFYYLAGYQLHYRDSRGNTEMPSAEKATVELAQGCTVEQEFKISIQRLQKLSVQWGAYYRENSGTVTMTLLRADTGEILLQQEFDAAEIEENSILELTAETPLEGLYRVPLKLSVTSTSPVGAAASPMMTGTATDEDRTLWINGVETRGELCFAATGEDYVWTGLHYWEFAAGLGALIALYLIVAYRRVLDGKKSYTMMALIAVQKYSFLIRQLVVRDFKAKYKRSVLGVFWSFLNPLLNMLVQFVVFSNVFRFGIDKFPVYLLCGNVIFNYFSEACGMALTSITGNARLITKVYVPKYIYPLTRILSSLINMLISLIPLLIVAFAMGLRPTKAYLLMPFPLLCLAIFCLGLAMLLSAAMVFFRDIQFLWNVMATIWMYLTPVFYPVSSLGPRLLKIVKLNPLYYYITFMRTCVMQGVSPEPTVYVCCFVFAVAMFALGAFVFKKTQDSFVLYL